MMATKLSKLVHTCNKHAFEPLCSKHSNTESQILNPLQVITHVQVKYMPPHL